MPARRCATAATFLAALTIFLCRPPVAFSDAPPRPASTTTWDQDYDAGQRAIEAAKFDQAERLWKSALLKAIAAHPKNRHPAALAHGKLAMLYCGLLRFDEAPPHFEAYFDAVGTPLPLQSQVGDTAAAYGGCLIYLRRTGDGEAWLVRGREILLKTDGPDAPATLRSDVFLGLLRAVQKRYGEAHAIFARAGAAFEAKYGPADHRLFLVRLAAGDAFREDGQLAKAEPLYEACLSLVRSRAGSPAAILACEKMAQLRMAQSRFTEAAAVLKEARGHHAHGFGADHRAVYLADARAAGYYAQHRQLGRAEAVCKAALSETARRFGQKDEAHAVTQAALAEVYRLGGRLAEAEALFNKALPTLIAARPLSHPLVADCLSNYATLLRDTGRGSSVEPLYARAREARARSASAPAAERVHSAAVQ